MKVDNTIIRPGRSSDRKAIVSFTRDTFHWGDYIPEVFTRWVRSKTGRLLVAELDGRPMGMIHVAFIGEHEAWMQGMRVDPRFRRRGIAAKLDTAGLAIAREAGCDVARLETAGDNHRAQAALAGFGYHRRVVYREWVDRQIACEPGHARPAARRDLSTLWGLWESSLFRHAAKGLVPLPSGWQWGQLTRSRLREMVDRGSIRVSPIGQEPDGFAVVRRGDSFDLTVLVGNPKARQCLLAAARCEAFRRGYKQIYLIWPDSARLGIWARQAGFARDKGSLLIYEHEL